MINSKRCNYRIFTCVFIIAYLPLKQKISQENENKGINNVAFKR